MGAFDKFKSAEVMGVRQYIIAGQHRFMVKRAEMGPSKNPQKPNLERTIIEFSIVKSTTMEEGAICALIEVSSNQGYYGNVLNAVAGIMGYEVEDMRDDKDFDATFLGVFGEAQIIAGFLVDCVAQQVKTKAGGDYTAKTWSPVGASQYAKHSLIAPEGAFVSSIASGAETH